MSKNLIKTAVSEHLSEAVQRRMLCNHSTPLMKSDTIKAESGAAHQLLMSHEIWDMASHIGSDIY